MTEAEKLRIKVADLETQLEGLARTELRSHGNFVKCKGEKIKLKEEFRLWLEADDFVYSQAILATPTGDLRNKLTEMNIERLQKIQDLKTK